MVDNNEIREARAWARGSYPAGRDVAAKLLLQLTEEPSLESLEWDEKKHFLLGVLDTDGDDGVLVGSTEYGTFDVYYPQYSGIVTMSNVDLRLNGKKYRITGEEDSAKSVEDRPKMLIHLADYENAPAGTVVALNQFTPWTKMSDGKWESGTSRVGSGDLRLSGPHKVLRWEW